MSGTAVDADAKAQPSRGRATTEDGVAMRGRHIARCMHASDDEERDKDANSGDSLRYGRTEMTDRDEEPDVDAVEHGDDYSGREQVP